MARMDSVSVFGTAELSALVAQAQSESLVRLPGLPPAAPGLRDESDALCVLLENVCVQAGGLDTTASPRTFELGSAVVARRRLRQRRAEEAAKEAQREQELERQRAEKREQHQVRMQMVQRDRRRRAQDRRRKERAQRVALLEERRRQEVAKDRRRGRLESQSKANPDRVAQEVARRQRDLQQVEEQTLLLPERQLEEAACKAAGGADAKQRAAATAFVAQCQGAAADEEPATGASYLCGGATPQDAAIKRLRHRGEARRLQLQEDEELFGWQPEAQRETPRAEAAKLLKPSVRVARRDPRANRENEEDQSDEPRDPTAIAPVLNSKQKDMCPASKTKNRVALMPRVQECRQKANRRQRRDAEKFRLLVQVFVEESDANARACKMFSPRSTRSSDLHQPAVALESDLTAGRSAEERARLVRRDEVTVEEESVRLEEQESKRVAAMRRGKLRQSVARARHRNATVRAGPTGVVSPSDAKQPVVPEEKSFN